MNSLLEVKFVSTKKGKGVFAKKDIEKGMIIDIAHVVPIPNKDYKKIKKTVLFNYCYIWEDPKHRPEFTNAITLSISQFINHSYDPNVVYLYDYKNQAIEFSALKDISQGEELLVNYNGLVDDKSPVWFKIE
ncbi:MAG: SET domain-containing protein-lysine N-methyltransferase [Promethearchaeota archaeon]|jgi:SET domain-containing protein